MPGDVGPADGFPHRPLDQRDTPLPALAQLGGAAQDAAVKVEVFLDECLGQVAGRAVDHLPAQPVPPRRNVLVGEQRGQPGAEARLAEHDLVEGASGRVQGRQPPPQVRPLRQHAGPGEQVVSLLAVAARDVVPVVPGHRRLQREHSAGGPVGVRQPGQLEHALHMTSERVADASEPLLAVVALVRQRDSSLPEKHQVTLRVARVGVNKEPVQAPDSQSLQPPERLQQLRDGADRPSRRERLADGLRAEQLCPVRIHEARIHVAELPLLAAFWCRRGLFHDLAHRVLSLFSQNPERAVARPVRGDLGPRQPPAVDVPEQVVLRADTGIELVDGDTGWERHAL